MQTRPGLYQLASQLAGLGIWEYNLENGQVYINDIVRNIVELPGTQQPSPDAFLGFFEDASTIRSLTGEVTRTASPCMITTRLITITGQRKWVKLRIQGSYEQGMCRFLYGTLEDVTVEETLQRLLEEREQRFSQAFNNAPIGMALVGLSGSWIKVNASLCEMMGYPEDEFLKHTFQDFTYHADLEIDLGYVTQLLAGRIKSYSMEKRYLHRNGNLIWALLNVSLVKSSSGEPLYFVSQIKDITEQKRNAETIRAQNDRLLNFAHIVSHNLRSHTGNIKALTDLVLREANPAEASHLMRLLSDSADSLLETISDLNNVVVIQEKTSVEKQWLVLSEMVERVRTILYASLLQEQAELRNQLPATIQVLFNPAYLESIFVNLVSNSLRYRHPERHPVIDITATETGDSIQVKVSDNGRGFDMKLYGSKLFGMYKTFHGHPDSRGLGLFMVRSQAEAMGGSVTAESVVNTGTIFTIDIPKPRHEKY
ncbi:sensor histidine kinase [Sediminibacterium soli]|uniref:sensor histidine kinase n=1 Tax=Sediminibacterium soli TaxID=2698829 RepID=UPI00137B1B6D|nr:HAMP domain-containing sensor histidine kinase [Sediminibacterium soli]NCI45254.1 PAS domain S-box protein [Sediminibacterium soli]